MGFLLFVGGFAADACEVENKVAYQRAKEFKQSGAYLLAVDCYTSALVSAREENNKARVLSILRHRGESYQYAGDYALAWLDLASGRLQEPHKTRFYEGLGWLYVFTGQYTQAVDQLQQAIKLSPENKWAQLNLGWAYYLKGETDRAFALWLPLRKEGRYRRALLKDMGLLKKQGVAQERFDPLVNWLK